MKEEEKERKFLSKQLSSEAENVSLKEGNWIYNSRHLMWSQFIVIIFQRSHLLKLRE